MKTKSPAAKKPDSEEPRKMPAPETPREPSEENGFERKSFAFYTDAKGNVQWDKMREKTKAELRDFLKRPDIGRALGVEAPAEVVELMSVEWCANLYDAVGKIEAALATKWKGVPKEIADVAFTYSKLEKEHLGPPTARVINKYATAWMVKFKDEIALAFLLVTITMAKVQLCNALIEQVNRGGAPVAETPVDNSKKEPETVLQ
jgi:hypothetical protein